MRKLKLNFTINQIGKFRFYNGVLIGIGFSLAFNFLLRQTLRIANLGLHINNWNLNYQINDFYLILIGYTSVGFSFCFTTFIWMGKPRIINRNKIRKMRVAQYNSLWILFATLAFLARLFLFFWSLDLSLEKDFPFTSYLISIFIYLYCWNLISVIYKSKSAFVIFTLCVIFIGYILSLI